MWIRNGKFVIWIFIVVGVVSICFFTQFASKPINKVMFTEEHDYDNSPINGAATFNEKTNKTWVNTGSNGPHNSQGNPEPPPDLDEARKWAKENMDVALAWLSEAPPNLVREVVAQTVCVHIAETNPVLAVSLAETYAPEDTYLLENLTYQWAESNFEAALSYALSKSPGEKRDRLLSRIVLLQAKRDPEGAARLAVNEIMPGPVQNEAVLSIIHQWALQNPNEVLGWIYQFPEGELRERVLREVENIMRPPISSPSSVDAE